MVGVTVFRGRVLGAVGVVGVVEALGVVEVRSQFSLFRTPRVVKAQHY